MEVNKEQKVYSAWILDKNPDLGYLNPFIVDVFIGRKVNDPY